MGSGLLGNACIRCGCREGFVFCWYVWLKGNWSRRGGLGIAGKCMKQVWLYGGICFLLFGSVVGDMTL
jgi:hypothetical protein